MIFSSTSMLDLFLLLNIISTALASPVAQYYPAQSFDLAALPSDGSLNLAPSPAATDPSLMGSDPMQIAEVGVAEPQVRPGTEKKEQPQKPGQPNPQQPQDKVTCPNGKIPSCCIGTAGQDSQGSFLSGCAEYHPAEEWCSDRNNQKCCNKLTPDFYGYECDPAEVKAWWETLPQMPELPSGTGIGPAFPQINNLWIPGEQL